MIAVLVSALLVGSVVFVVVWSVTHQPPESLDDDG